MYVCVFLCWVYVCGVCESVFLCYELVCVWCMWICLFLSVCLYIFACGCWCVWVFVYVYVGCTYCVCGVCVLCSMVEFWFVGICNLCLSFVCVCVCYERLCL